MYFLMNKQSHFMNVTLLIDWLVVKTLKASTDSADAIKDYGPIFMESGEYLTIPYLFDK